MAHRSEEAPEPQGPTHLDAGRLDEIEAGCEGVTPGPWFQSGYVHAMGWGVDSSRQHEDAPLICENAVQKDAAHIARLSPEVVRELVRGYREGQRRTLSEDIARCNDVVMLTRERDRLREAIESHRDAYKADWGNRWRGSYDEALWAVLDDA